jgi:hypothetical protein
MKISASSGALGVADSDERLGGVWAKAVQQRTNAATSANACFMGNVLMRLLRRDGIRK